MHRMRQTGESDRHWKINVLPQTSRPVFAPKRPLSTSAVRFRTVLRGRPQVSRPSSASNTIPIRTENATAWNRNSPNTANANVPVWCGRIMRPSVNRLPATPLAKEKSRRGKRLARMGKRKQSRITGTNSPAPPARRRHFYRGEDGDISNVLRHPQGIKLESSELRT